MFLKAQSLEFVCVLILHAYYLNCAHLFLTVFITPADVVSGRPIGGRGTCDGQSEWNIFREWTSHHILVMKMPEMKLERYGLDRTGLTSTHSEEPGCGTQCCDQRSVPTGELVPRRARAQSLAEELRVFFPVEKRVATMRFWVKENCCLCTCTK